MALFWEEWKKCWRGRTAPLCLLALLAAAVVAVCAFTAGMLWRAKTPAAHVCDGARLVWRAEVGRA